jgi:two-component system, cell cycle response regulator
MKVLVADDEAVSLRLIESSLGRWGYDVVTATDGIEALAILNATERPTLAILDWMMPGMSGVDICRELRLHKSEGEYTYVILLTAKRAKDDVIQGLEAGADDYLTKPFHPQELRVRLRTGRRILYLLEQLVVAREALRDQATHDVLTQLWNRVALMEILDKELARAQREESSLGIILVDLDHFKLVNDRHGHRAGDDVLREAAEAMRSTTRPYDAVGRYGGEEFLVILPGCDQVNAVSHAERLRKVVSQVAVAAPGGEIRCTASLGVTVGGYGVELDPTVLIEAADAALYRAKAAGRDRAEFAAAKEFARKPGAEPGRLPDAASEADKAAV